MYQAVDTARAKDLADTYKHHKPSQVSDKQIKTSEVAHEILVFIS